MRAARWLAMSLTLALAAAEANGLHKRQKRQGIIFPDSIPSPGSGPRHPVNGPDATLELPENLDLNSVDRDSLFLINSIDNITDFAKLFGIPLPSGATDVGFELSTRTGGGIEEASMAKCKPEMKTVDLDLPVEANTVFYPTCVRLDQCGGCCFGPLLTCRPMVTKVVKLKVLKTVVGSGSRRSGAGRVRRRRQEPVSNFLEVEVLKHEQCECGCKVQEKDCKPAIHTYLEAECACVCKNKNEKVRCEQQNGTKYWDNGSCTCFCRRQVDCGSGEIFSQTTCKCEKLTFGG